jgi:hypothetical protein
MKYPAPPRHNVTADLIRGSVDCRNKSGDDDWWECGDGGYDPIGYGGLLLAAQPFDLVEQL